eukprot:6516046-Heterocapsa_arctica.AAC.1
MGLAPSVEKGWQGVPPMRSTTVDLCALALTMSASASRSCTRSDVSRNGFQPETNSLRCSALSHAWPV